VTSSKRSGRRRRRGARLLLALTGATALAGTVAFLWWRSLPDPSGLANRPPRTTALMDQRREEARRAGRSLRVDYRPVSLDRISGRLADAVRLSEDASFFAHEGFDWKEIRSAAESNVHAGRTVRGASTITQQLAKNLYLGTERTYARKLREAALAIKLERTLSKRRILTLYLDVVEWADGVFGAEAAARHWFGIGAADLDAAQAAALAAMLPAPRRAALSPAPPWLARRARRILGWMEETRRIGPTDAAAARSELERLLGPPVEGEDEPPAEE
jgi:monofunctional biosynthetic peptidoglycan transglycosylase